MVLIWLGESEDINFGLRIIIAMVEALRAKYGDQFDMVTIDDDQVESLFYMRSPYGDRVLHWQDFREALDRLFSNPYFNRIWVLQEALCNAEKTLIHTSQHRTSSLALDFDRNSLQITVRKSIHSLEYQQLTSNLGTLD